MFVTLLLSNTAISSWPSTSQGIPKPSKMLRLNPTQISLAPSDLLATTQRLIERRERQNARKLSLPIRTKAIPEKHQPKNVEKKKVVGYRFPNPPNGRPRQSYSEEDTTSDNPPNSSATSGKQSYTENIVVLEQPVPPNSRIFWDSIVAEAGSSSTTQLDEPTPLREDLLSSTDLEHFNFPQVPGYEGLYRSDGIIYGTVGQQEGHANQTRQISNTSFGSQLDLVETYHDRSGQDEGHTGSSLSTSSSLISPRRARGPVGYSSLHVERHHNSPVNLDGSGESSPGRVSTRALDPRSPPFIAGLGSVHPPLVIRPSRSGVPSRTLDPSLPPFISELEATSPARAHTRPLGHQHSSGVSDAASELFIPESESTSPPLAYTRSSHRGLTSRSTLPRSSLYISQAVASSSPDKRLPTNELTSASIEEEIPTLARPPRRQKGYKPRSTTYSWEESETEREPVHIHEAQNSRSEGSSVAAASGMTHPSSNAMRLHPEVHSPNHQSTSRHPTPQNSSPTLPPPFSTTPRSPSSQTPTISSPATYTHSPHQRSSSSSPEDLTAQLDSSSHNLSQLRHTIAQITQHTTSSHPTATTPSRAPLHYTPSPSPPPPHTPHRSMRVYDDALPASLQPQTPANLRARPFPNAAFTAPVGAGRRVEVRTPRRVGRRDGRREGEVSPTRGMGRRRRNVWSEDQENLGEAEVEMLRLEEEEMGVRGGEGGRLEWTPPRGGRWWSGED
ncbi:MAG: hypothetical protein M1836_005894 [Candelina mexicana]|nr:MAG: hypothetical protein M1836_005894 [Candelina mexicana]